MTTLLNEAGRSELENYMIECHGYDDDQIQEWESKSDLIDDIIHFGHAEECLEYLT